MKFPIFYIINIIIRNLAIQFLESKMWGMTIIKTTGIEIYNLLLPWYVKNCSTVAILTNSTLRCAPQIKLLPNKIK